MGHITQTVSMGWGIRRTDNGWFFERWTSFYPQFTESLTELYIFEVHERDWAYGKCIDLVRQHCDAEVVPLTRTVTVQIGEQEP